MVLTVKLIQGQGLFKIKRFRFFQIFPDILTKLSVETKLESYLACYLLEMVCRQLYYPQQQRMHQAQAHRRQSCRWPGLTHQQQQLCQTEGEMSADWTSRWRKNLKFIMFIKLRKYLHSRWDSSTSFCMFGCKTVSNGYC